MLEFLKTLHFKRDPRLIVFAAILVIVFGALMAKGVVTTKEGLAFLSGALALPGLFGAKQDDDADPPASPRSPTTTAAKKPGSGGLGRFAMASAIAALTFALMLVAPGCSRTATPADVEAGVSVADGACSLLEGITQNKTIISICATVEEIGVIASIVAPFLLREGAADAACKPLPKTALCLTPMQIGTGIQVVLERRRERLFLLDAGAQ